MSLYLRGVMGKKITIVDDTGKTHTVAQARSLWKAGVVDNYNAAMLRFANFGFDIDKLRAHYKGGGR